MSYTNLLYHIVYATKERAPLITNALRPRLHEYLGGTVRGIGGIALEINGTNDHVHVLAKVRRQFPCQNSLASSSQPLRVGRSDKQMAGSVGKLGSAPLQSASRKSSE